VADSERLATIREFANKRVVRVQNVLVYVSQIDAYRETESKVG
jgi:hypothetical protein